MENAFVKIAKGEGQGNLTETIYQMDGVQQVLLKTFLQSRNQALLFSKGNVGEDGKPTTVDPKQYWDRKILLIAETSNR